MRLTASFSALLVLAVLLFVPATLPAKTTHHRARKSATSHRQVHPKTTTKSARTTKRSSAHTRAKAKPVSAHKRSSRHVAKRTVKATSHKSASRRLTASAKEATSADFVAAAKGEHSEKSTERAEVSSHSRARTRKASATRRSRSVAKPVPVVDVVRPAAERPQLQSVADEATKPEVLPTLYNKRGRLIVPPPLRGSHEILVHQNEVADREGLDRIQNMDDLMDMRSKRILVPLPTSYALSVDDRLPSDRRYCRPWTAQFLKNMARAHYARFHSPLQINSAVRTVEFQQKLIRVNGNAAPAEGDTASPHLTGQAIDIAKHGLSRTEIAWMRGYLLPLIQEGKIDVEEEFQQACFHISVYKKYLPPADAPRRDLATHRGSEASALATAIH
ncbi:MAG TPA: DUF5715 family protein [Edaphobacter sp.]|nr:DUF5715 family protein [Edaphobacter sp.]